MKPNVTKENLTLLIEGSRQRVLEVLFKYPDKEFSLSELAKESGVAKAHIGTILEELKKKEITEIIKLSKIWRIRANQVSPSYIKTKIVYNLNFVYQSGLVEFLDNHYNHPKAIILFGSFRKGEDISTSDIDIAIEDDTTEEYKVIRLGVLISKFERYINREIHIHLFNKVNIDINVFNNIANGIVLQGFLEVKP